MMTKTKNDLTEATRTKVCGFLNQSLADALDLAYQGKQAHWNVKGLQFKSLHELFDEVVDTARKYLDEFAERAVQLGGVAEGTIRAASQRSSLPEYPLGVVPAIEHLNILGDRVALFGKNIRACISACTEAEDLVTADIYTDAAREIDKLTWMIEASLSELGQSGRRDATKAA